MDRFFRGRMESPLVPLLYIALGLVLVLYPAMSGQVFCWVLGIGAFVYAAVQGMAALSARRAGFSAPSAVIGCIALVCLGIACFSAPRVLLSLLPFVLGGILVLDGVTRVPMAWDAVRAGAPMSWLFVLITLVPFVLGVILLLRPFFAVTAVIRFFGVSIIMGGVLDLVGARCR